MARLIVIMGPSGCGKSTLASTYAAQIGGAFVEGDDYHPSENIARMESGAPLSDSHRAAWLDDLIPAVNGKPEAMVALACSALTPFVQTRLRLESARPVTFVYCDVPHAVLAKRLRCREGHFMPPDLLDSQLDSLHLPDDVLSIDANAPRNTVLQRLIDALEHQR